MYAPSEARKHGDTFSGVDLGIPAGQALSEASRNHVRHAAMLPTTGEALSLASGAMSTKTPLRARRPRGSLDPEHTAAVFAKVDRGTKDVLDSIADASGKSLGVVLEELTRHLELDERGVPVWWTDGLPQQEELPLKTA